jgi:hypothetical protein
MKRDPIETEHEWLRKGALKKASGMVKGKGGDYGHFSEYPEVVLASNIFTKAKRLLNLAIKATRGGKEVNEPMEDSALDLINYASFIYSKVMHRKGGRRAGK